MDAKTILEELARTIRRHRSIDRLLTACAPILASVLVGWILYQRLLPAFAILPMIGVLLVSILFFIKQISQQRPIDPRREAARLLDLQTSGKERFLTLASIAEPVSPELQNSLRMIEAQINSIARNLEPSKPRLSLSAAARTSVALVPLLLICFALIAWKTRTIRSAEPSPAQLQQMAKLEILRELADKLPPNAGALEDQLNSVADLIEEKGLLDEDTQIELDRALAKVDAEVDSETLRQEDFPHQSQPTPGATPPVEQSGKQQEEAKSGSKQGSAETQDKQSGASEKEEKKSSGKQGESKESSQKSGNKKSDEKKEGSEKSADAKEGTKGNAPQPEEKKDVTGVGEGKGKGKNGADKPQQGETQSGSESKGAKEGEAKNQSGDKDQSSDGAKSGEGKGEKKEPKEQGSNSEREQGGTPKEDAKTEQGESKNDTGDTLNKIKEELEQIKKQSESEAEKKKDQSEEGQGGEGNKPQEDQEQSDPEKKGKQGDSKQPGEGKTEKQDGEQKNSGSKDEGSKSSDQKQSDKQKPEQKPGDKGGESPEKGEDPEGDQPTPEQKAGQKPGESPRTGEKRDESSNASDSADGERDATQDPATNSQNRKPNPSDNAQRFGPFDGGTEGDLKDKGIQGTKIEVPREQKIIVRGLGAEENKLYRNKEGAKAKTAIGGTEFKKPEADVSRKIQPIPAEYGDLLR